MNALSHQLFNPRGWGRGLKKSAAIAAILAILLLFAGQGQTVYAANITVTTTDDELNLDGDCSLREAIQAANTNAAVDACAAGEGPPTVDVINFSVSGTITLTSGQLIITDDLTINGPGAPNLVISGNNASRVLQVSGGVTVALEGVTVVNGFAGADAYVGGGIFNSGTLTVTNSTFLGNSVWNYGGGIYNSGGTLTVTNSMFSGNSGGAGGGGVYNGGTLTVTNTTFSGNSAGNGGGIRNDFGSTLTVTNSTFSGNSAGPRGGGISNFATATVTNSTFSGNSASYEGAGIFSFSGTTTVVNTIVANSPSGGNCGGGISDGGGNLSWPDSTCPGINQDPLLDPAGPQDNGGTTTTIALQPGSPAIDAAVLANCPPTDQRGVARPQGAACDIGAYELVQTQGDTTAPTITITAPADGATYLLGQVVSADYTCEDEPGGSGLASCVGTVPNGSAIDTASVGAKTFTVDTADNAGNMSSVSISYNVIYNFDGFFSPVDNPPTLNEAKAGQTVPLKWRITDAGGKPVTNLTSATLMAVSLACDLSITTDQIEEYASGGSGLQNLGDGYYQFNWKTPKSYANSCKTLKLNLGDGLAHEALFRFTE